MQYYTLHQHGVKQKVHQVQRKQIDSHKLCLKCPTLARTQARKRVRHWLTASSISDCSKPRHTCSRHCRSSSMSRTLVSYTRAQWQTIAPYMWPLNSPDLNLVDYAIWSVIQLDAAGNIQRVHYKSMKCDVSFLLGSISTLFRWDGHFCHVCVKHFFLLITVQNSKNRSRFSRVMITKLYCHLFMVHSVYLSTRISIDSDNKILNWS